jgi:hypothetical protein
MAILLKIRVAGNLNRIQVTIIVSKISAPCVTKLWLLEGSRMTMVKKVDTLLNVVLGVMQFA